MYDYDYIIVGGGISGLYSAYRLIYKNQNQKPLKILLLEKNSKRWIGGRMGYYPFHGMDVSIGCGIGRKKKDTLLIQLMKELGVAFKETYVSNQIADNIEQYADIPYIVSVLKTAYLSTGFECNKSNERVKEGSHGISFKDFALPILGKKLYDTFLITSGYTDYENEDIYETLYYYGMDDNTSGWTGLSISWRNLLGSLMEKLENKMEIKVSSEVTHIHRLSGGSESDSGFDVTLKTGVVYNSKHLILATTVQTVRELLPEYPIYRDIVGQPFLRIYGKFSHECVPVLKEHFSIGTMVKGPIHRIIPLNIDDGLFLIVYTDNNGALTLKKYTKNTSANRKYLCRLIESSCDLPKNVLFLTDIVSFYWDIGTHYYKPLNFSNEQSVSLHENLSRRRKPLSGRFYDRASFVHQAQRPMPGMFVVGEMVSRNQGWIEGALESVDAVL